MRVPALQTIVVKPELIRIVRRENSRKWQVHYKIEGVKTWFRKSVQTTDLDKAIQLAERMWMKATFDHEEGIQSQASRLWTSPTRPKQVKRSESGRLRCRDRE